MKASCAVLVLAVAAAGGLWVTMQQVGAPPGPEQPSSAAPSPREVAVAEVATVLFPTVLIRPGEVVAARRFRISPRSSGRLIRLSVRPGDRVAAGTEMALLSAPELEQALRQARAELDSAQAELIDAKADVERLTTLAKTKAISEDALRDTQVRRDRAQASVDAGEAAVSARSEDLAELTVRAPEDLIVLQRLREPGDLAGPALPVLEAESARETRFETWIPLRDTATLHRGMPIEIRFQGRDKPVLGQLSQIVSAADPITRTCKIEIALPSDAALISGEYGDAHILVGQSPISAIPSSALRMQAGVTGAFVLGQERKARYRTVRTGRRFESQVEILAGLVPGERVIVDPPAGLADGSRVEVRGP
ncbi:MAG: efflux RND transporter periplasmic adaptor subunit [Pseudomonadota bacterium]|nr:efflux RND transporter periplasmic adaptor subunit [Pseudomonadota bacterium]